MPDPRTIAETKNEKKPSGEPAICGPCGLPTRECQCRSYKDTGAEPREASHSAAFEAEGSSFKR